MWRIQKKSYRYGGYKKRDIDMEDTRTIDVEDTREP